MISIRNLFEVGKSIETGKTIENEMKKDDGDEIEEKIKDELDERGKPRMDGTGPRGMGKRMNQPGECRGNK